MRRIIKRIALLSAPFAAVLIVWAIAGIVPFAGRFQVLDIIVKKPLEIFSSATAGIKGLVYRSTGLSVEYDSRIQELEKEIRKLIFENAQLLDVRKENAELRRELNFLEQNPLPLVPARVIGRRNQGGSEILILNRGSADGVRLNAPVLSDGILVAKIVKLSEHISMAATLVSPGMKTAATFAGETQNNGIIEGEFNAGLVMRLIPKDAALREGNIVITSGLEPEIARGFIIGVVERFETNPQNLFQTAQLKSPARASALNIVSIVEFNK